MNNNERPRLSAVEEAEAMLRHPSIFGEAPARLAREAQRNYASEQLCGVAMHLYEYFRFGAPEATQELECFLLEGDTNRHAEVLLDELANALQVLGIQPETRGAA